MIETNRVFGSSTLDPANRATRLVQTHTALAAAALRAHARHSAHRYSLIPSASSLDGTAREVHHVLQAEPFGDFPKLGEGGREEQPAAARRGASRSGSANFEHCSPDAQRRRPIPPRSWPCRGERVARVIDHLVTSPRNHRRPPRRSQRVCSSLFSIQTLAVLIALTEQERATNAARDEVVPASNRGIDQLGASDCHEGSPGAAQILYATPVGPSMSFCVSVPKNDHGDWPSPRQRDRTVSQCVSLLLLLVCCALLGADPSESATKSRPAPADLAAYTVAKSKVGRDSDAHVRLAVWCESHGLSAERMKHLGAGRSH